MHLIRLQVVLVLALLYIGCMRLGLEFSQSISGRVIMVGTIVFLSKYDKWIAAFTLVFFLLLAELSTRKMNALIINEGFTPDANLHTLGGQEETGSYNVLQTTEAATTEKSVDIMAEYDATKEFQSSYCAKNKLIGGKPLPPAYKFANCANPCDPTCKITYDISAGDEQLTTAERLRPVSSGQGIGA
jgi:hypothetical protein